MKVTDGLETIIKEHVYEIYAKDDPRFPAGICNSCKKRLYDVKNSGIGAVPAQAKDASNIDYQQFKPLSPSSPCKCCLCSKVRVQMDSKSEKPDVPRRCTLDTNTRCSQDQAETDKVYHIFLCLSLSKYPSICMLVGEVSV